jgi:hypothetical protein
MQYFFQAWGARGPKEVPPSYVGQGVFHLEPARPPGEEPILSSPAADSYPQKEQIQGGPGASPQSGNPDRPAQLGGGMMDTVKDALS